MIKVNLGVPLGLDRGKKSKVGTYFLQLLEREYE